MLISDIVRRVREATGDLAVLQFTDATITDWINDGIELCVEENSLLQGKGVSNTVVNQKDYVLPVDIFKIHSVYFDEDKLRVLTLSEWEDLDLQRVEYGTPKYACIYAGVLSLSPTPDSVKPLTINYSKHPAVITFTPPSTWLPAAPPLPTSFHNRIVTYCLAQVALQDDDFAKYQALLSEFRSGVMDLKHLQDQTENLYPYNHYVEDA
jgi:hypothetical protein